MPPKGGISVFIKANLHSYSNKTYTKALNPW